MKAWLLSLLSGCVVLLGAADLNTKSGKTYKDYEVTGVTGNGLTILHGSGSATVPFEELPDPVRKKYASQEKELIAEMKLREEKRKQDQAEKIKLPGEESQPQVPARQKTDQETTERKKTPALTDRITPADIPLDWLGRSADEIIKDSSIKLTRTGGKEAESLFGNIWLYGNQGEIIFVFKEGILQELRVCFVLSEATRLSIGGKHTRRENIPLTQRLWDQIKPYYDRNFSVATERQVDWGSSSGRLAEWGNSDIEIRLCDRREPTITDSFGNKYGRRSVSVEISKPRQVLNSRIKRK